MEINRRIAELESVFPLAGVDDGYILSRSGDVTVGWELTLPTAFTVDRASYDAMLRHKGAAGLDHGAPPGHIPGQDVQGGGQDGFP